jgi:hypothetical protein
VKRLCDAPQIQQKFLEGRVWENLWSTVTNADRLYRMIETSYRNISAPGPSPRIAELEEQLRRLRDAEETAYINLKDPKLQAIRARTLTDWEDARKCRNMAEMELGQLRRQATQQMPGREPIMAMANKLRAHEPTGFEERQTFLKLLVNEISLSSSEAIVECVIPATVMAGPGKGEEKRNKKSDERIYGHQTFAYALSSPPVNQPIPFTINVKL